MYETFIKCGREGCNSRRQVPGPGALPQGWSVIGWQKKAGQVAVLNEAAPDRQQMQPQLIQTPFCSWKCMMHFVKGFLTGETKDDLEPDN